jgi:hypothetical protein
MIFTFDIESSFNVPNFGRSYTLDVTNERMQKQMEYEHVHEFNQIQASLRHSPRHEIKGELVSEITFENVAWSWTTGCLLGTRTTIDGYKFSESNNAWKLLIGYVDSGFASDSTTFTINEDVAGAFDSVDAVIINGEFITISAISNGSVTACSRGQEGTTAQAHEIKDLVYGVEADVARSIVLTHRKKTSNFYINNISLSTVHDRSDVLYGYSGVYFEEMTFNFRTFEPIVAHLFFVGADSTNNISLLDSAAVDNNPIVDLVDVKVYSEHEVEELRQFFIQIHNTIEPASHGFGSVPQGFFTSKASTFGVMTWMEESLDNLLEYENNTKRHFSISVGEGNYRMIFALNDVRVNTVSHYLDSELIIQDSAPWYSYAAPVVMYQF